MQHWNRSANPDDMRRLFGEEEERWSGSYHRICFSKFDPAEAEDFEIDIVAASEHEGGTSPPEISDLAKLLSRHATAVEVEMGHLLAALGRTRTPSVRAIIDGKVVEFSTKEEKFDALVAEWRRLREPGSSTDILVNDAYGQIVAMGWDAVPLLLREVERKSGHWFTALKWITNQTVVTPEMRGNVREIRKAWLKWGAENGQSGRVVQGRELAQDVSTETSHR